MPFQVQKWSAFCWTCWMLGTSRNEQNSYTHEVKELVLKNREISTCDVANMLGISIGSVYSILKYNLHMHQTAKCQMTSWVTVSTHARTIKRGLTSGPDILSRWSQVIKCGFTDTAQRTMTSPWFKQTWGMCLPSFKQTSQNVPHCDTITELAI